MNWERECVAVIPCLNEAASIGPVVAGVRRHLPAVIVVDDGSTDATAHFAITAGAEVLQHGSNCGKGAALATGWARARQRGFHWALTLDGDGQHAPDDIPALLACAEATGAKLVVGNRLAQAEAMPWLRRVVNDWMTRRISRLVGVPLADSQCGFRLLQLETVFRLRPVAEHFEIESEVLVAFVAGGAAVEFVPVQTLYKSRASKVHPLTDGWRWLQWWAARRQLARRAARAAASAKFRAIPAGGLSSGLGEAPLPFPQVAAGQWREATPGCESGALHPPAACVRLPRIKL